MLPGPAFVSPQGGAALRVSPHGGPGLQPLWRAAAVLPGCICADCARTQPGGRGEAKQRQGHRCAWSPKESGHARNPTPRATGPTDSASPRAPGNRTRLLPTAFFIQLLRSIEYPAILRPCDLRFYRRNTRVYSTDSVSDTKNVMDTTLTPTPEGENRVGVRRLARREARERGATGEHAKGSDPETRNPRHVSLFSYKASSAQAAGTRRV